MAARPLLQDQPRRGGVQQKNGEGDRKNRTALGDIGNVVTARGGNGIAKPQAGNRPLTRSFCAQLVANAQVAAQKNQTTLQKQGVQVVDVNVAGARKTVAGVQKKLQEKNSKHGKVELKPTSKKKKSPTLTAFLTAHSKEACGLTKKPQELIVNIDEGSIEDELAVVEYVEDIYKFYEIAEEESRVRDYMNSQSQPDINEKMRSILVDWLIEVHYKFELRQETLYLTINIIDRFLSIKVVPRKELQLVGIASMLIACKYEEIWAPEVNDFVQISDKAYVREQVLAMEKAILGSLEWYLTVPTPYMFLTRFIKASSAPSDSEMENMVYFFAELGIMNYSTTIKYPPSLLAASSVYAARCTLNNSPSWTETLQHYTGYSENQIKECARLLVSFHMAAPESKLRAVYKKFSKPDNGMVALRSPAKSLLAST
ncbi:G2/mitotic-specific cyclin S13-7 isoform X2 [Beta vulgaris subsp. vulgaris]|uniref:G2/mitotic-specific cyclin S13-7 isoform X2 n=1 Tax=Beta vulgaris subsp. vulgaris TaxID=3555 RepID=UPI00254936BF|nr:G2/mitotic-specific cyclin S13-7 isoform X2 [Beta vulgaris subsp. vulgaris]